MSGLAVKFRLFMLVFWVLLILLPLPVVHCARVLIPWYKRMFFRGAARVMGMRVRVVSGRLSRARRVLVVCNHASYLDIVALGARFKVDFVSKDEVRGWPVFGFMATMGNTIYISRDRMKAKRELELIERASGSRRLPIVIFPEGTSSDGNAVLPFKSAMFALFEDYIGERGSSMVVQPVSIAYVRKGRRRMAAAERVLYGWPVGDERTIWRHIRDVLEGGRFGVDVIVHDPVDLSRFKDRKELALYCRGVVAGGFAELLKGEGSI